MKKLLIIYPHWIPSNLVGVQRARLIANFLPDLGWQPILLAVRPEYYEEPLCPELERTVSPAVKVFWCDARKAVRPRIVGDIALRAFRQLRSAAIEIIRKEKPDFIWSPLPSFYTALIVRQVHDRTGIPYGLDYMDPWVHDFGGAKFPNRAWLAKRLAQWLEPIAVEKAALLTGVSELSYTPVIRRNPHLKGIVTGAMPLGFDRSDYHAKPSDTTLLWDGDGQEVRPLIYAGAFLPQSHLFVQTLFRVVARLRKEGRWDTRVRFYFVGTGNSPLMHVADYAREAGITDIVTEQTSRISYLEVLNNLSHAYGVLAIGNTEPHYTASKIFQTLLSGKRVFPIFHGRSTVIDILQEAKADNFLVSYSPDTAHDDFERTMERQLLRFLDNHELWEPALDRLNRYSARESARTLGSLIDKAITQSK